MAAPDEQVETAGHLQTETAESENFVAAGHAGQATHVVCAGHAGHVGEVGHKSAVQTRPPVELNHTINE